MKFSLIIPHYKQGQATANCIHSLFQNKGKHDIEIIVVDSGNGVGAEYLLPFRGQVQYIQYPSGKLQSHGISIEYALLNGLVSNEWFITLESDSYADNPFWLDYYADLIGIGYDAAASELTLSGGTYLHGCGGLYSKSLWRLAKSIIDATPYKYFPNMWQKDTFAYHTMIHDSHLDLVLNNPEDWMELSSGYRGLTKEQILKKAEEYLPTVCVFHNGMGGNQENVKTYGFRNIQSDSPTLLDIKHKIIARVGYEPHQWLTYFLYNRGERVRHIPTEVKWMEGRGGEQQEYTRTVNGLVHCWAGSSYLDMKDTPMHDVYEFKKNQIEQLYNELPSSLKINK